MNGTETRLRLSLEDAARVALKTVKEYLEAHPEIERVRFGLFGKAAYAVNEAARKGL